MYAIQQKYGFFNGCLRSQFLHISMDVSVHSSHFGSHETICNGSQGRSDFQKPSGRKGRSFLSQSFLVPVPIEIGVRIPVGVKQH